MASKSNPQFPRETAPQAAKGRQTGGKQAAKGRQTGGKQAAKGRRGGTFRAPAA